VHACGFCLGSFGAPGEPIASASKFLPLGKEEVARLGKLGIHSTRRGVGGEEERELRAYFRARREADADAKRRGPEVPTG